MKSQRDTLGKNWMGLIWVLIIGLKDNIKVYSWVGTQLHR